MLYIDFVVVLYCGCCCIFCVFVHACARARLFVLHIMLMFVVIRGDKLQRLRFGAGCLKHSKCNVNNTESCSNVDGTCQCKLGWIGNNAHTLKQ